MTLVDANGIVLNVQRYGRAPLDQATTPVVVCVHGLVLDSLASFYLTLAGPLAGAGAATVMYDLRGHGRSARPAEGYRLADHVNDLIGLLDALGLHQPVHLVGNSFGGTVAAAATAWFPERVAGLVMIEGFPPTDSWALKVEDLMTEGLRQLRDHTFAAESLGRPHRPAPRAVAQMHDLWTGTTIVRDVPYDLRTIAHPVLAVFGGDSTLARSATDLTELLPTARAEIIPGHDHFVLVKAHPAVSAQIVGWLATIDPRMRATRSSGRSRDAVLRPWPTMAVSGDPEP